MRILTALGCLGLLAFVAAVVGVASTHGRWGYVALEVAAVVLILTRIAAGRERG